MKKEKMLPFITPVIFGILSIYILISVQKMQARDAVFPQIIGWIMLMISIAEGLSQWKKKTSVHYFSQINLKKVVQIIGGLFFYIYLLRKIGYCLDTMMLCMYIMWMLGYRRKGIMIASSVLITAVVFGMFYLLIKVPLPTIIL